MKLAKTSILILATRQAYRDWEAARQALRQDPANTALIAWERNFWEIYHSLLDEQREEYTIRNGGTLK